MITIDYATEDAVYLGVNSFKAETEPGVVKVFPFKKSGVNFRLHKNFWTKGDWVCACAQFVDPKGRGQNFLDAFQDWASKFARNVEEVLGKRPFEWSESEELFHNELRRRFDFRRYRDVNPLLTKRRGVVATNVGEPLASYVPILWPNGWVDRIPARRLPSELKSLKPGDAFFVLAEIDFHTGDAVGVNKVYWIKKKGE